jgi:uncharacterized membrane protein
MAGSQESAREASNSREGLASDSINTTTPHNPRGDAQMLAVDLQAYLNAFPIRAIHAHERNARVMYHTMKWLIDLLLISQAALSAVLVAVSVMKIENQKTVTVLGVMNGIITSILAIIEGQGLAGRYYQYAAGLRSVMREIERLHRMMIANMVVTKQDCSDLNDLYERVEKENDRNGSDVLDTGRIFLEE